MENKAERIYTQEEGKDKKLIRCGVELQVEF